jgi:hypothetical protein
MAATGYTPIQLYYSTTAAAVPTAGNLASGELAINITDGKLYYKSNAGVVTLLAGATAGPAGGSNTQVQFNSSGSILTTTDINGGTIDGTTIGANVPAVGVFTNLRVGTATSDELLTINGSSAGFVARITNTTASNPNGLYINSTNAIGTGTAFRVDSAGTPLLALNTTGLTIGGATPRILANMSGTQSTRFAIQNSTTDGNTRFFLYPNGTGSISAINGRNNSDVAAVNYQEFDLGVIATSDVRLSSAAAGSSTALPITFYISGGEVGRFATNGRFGIGSNNPSTNLTIGGTAASGGAGGTLGVFLSRGATTNFYEAFDGTKSFIAGVDNTQSFAKVGTLSSHDLAIITGNGAKIYIANSTGYVGVGTSSPAGVLHVSGDNGPLRISGTGYIVDPSQLTLGQYTSTRAYIQPPAGGQVEIWDDGTNVIAQFLDNRTVQIAYTLGVGNAIPSTSGAGITFPATQSSSTSANTLDDYEEGTFTPVIVGSGSNPTVSYSAQAGNYVKIGQLVYFNIFTKIASVSGGSGSVYINGLPFTSQAGSQYAPPVSAWLSATTLGANNIPSPIVIYGDTQLWMSYINNTSGAAYSLITTAQLAADNEWRISGCYQAAA